MTSTDASQALPQPALPVPGHGGLAPPPPSAKLRQLVTMRNIAIVGQVVTIAVVDRVLGIPLPLLPMGIVVLSLALFNFYAWRRLAQANPVTDTEVVFQLVVDIVALTILLCLSGGADNPFVGMYLLPLTIVAAWLPSRYTWGFALATVACYSVTAVLYRPLLPDGEDARLVPLLKAGMWINYVVIAGMIAHFVVRIIASLREDQRRIAALREREMCSEYVVRIGTLAAGAAHELSSPLAGMAIVLDEIRERSDDPGAVESAVATLSEQLAACRETLDSLFDYGRRTFAAGGPPVALDTFLRASVAAFGARRPEARVTFTVDTPGAPPLTPADPGLRQALLNLLANAADVSPHAIELRVNWDDRWIRIVVRDRGPGIRSDVEDKVGSLFFTTKAHGRGTGLGLYLAHAAVRRLGGQLLLGNAAGGGAAAEIRLPVAQMDPLDLDLIGRQ